MNTHLNRGALALRSGAAMAALLVGALTAGSSFAGSVTFDRLVHADSEPQNWLTNHKNYSSTRHSTLNQITKDNVGQLHMLFSLALGSMEPGGNYKNASLQATPLVDDGIMYVTDGWSSLYRVDVSDGKRALISWKMDPGTDRSYAAGIPNNRGAALLGDAAYSLTVDGRLVKTDANTGEILWDQEVATEDREYLTVAPLAVKDKIVFGVSGADSGIRGWIQANNASDGARAWRWYIVPAPGEPGSESWKDDWNAWQVGGGSAWVTGSYDVAQDLIIWGTGNPAPDFDNSARPGDNLFTNSVVALETDSGKMRWYFQFTPSDSWDYDEVGAHILVDTEIDGQMRQVVTHAGRNGIFYTLDRTTGAFVNGGQYVQELNWTAGLDPKTGKPVEYDPSKAVQTYRTEAMPTHAEPVKNVCPTIGGGNNYYPPAYSPDTGLFYVTGIEQCSNIDQIPFGPGEFQLGGNVGFGKIRPVHEVTHSTLSAIDPKTGKVQKQILLEYANYGGMLSTAGGMVFTGHLDGTFAAYDNQTLDELWSVNLGSPINAPPIAYEVNGKEYIAILVGTSNIARGNLFGHTELANMNAASMMFVFGL